MKPKKQNILFVMFDQLRFDYLGCCGHPHIKTPNIDRLAKKAVRFTHAYAQSTICGASRMSYYTGRYVASHGAAWNDFPLRVGEWTMGDHLRKAGMGCYLVGKTHMRVDAEGMARLGLAAESEVGARQAECGFDVVVREDGLVGQGPKGFYSDQQPYNAYLRSKGYGGENPWADFANAGDEDGMTASGWFMRHADKPANIAEQDSETPWLTRQAIRFLENAEGPWCAHVSYIKPHWPYIVPAPYHNMYGPEDVIPAIRSEGERMDPHPLYAAFMESGIAETFTRDEVREKVVPAYMGLISQCDTELGRILDHLERSGQAENTVIVVTSDHGDYLGDHWLGEKDMFHDVSVRVPMIIYDPSPAADSTRGTTCDALVEAIDLTPTFIEIAGGTVPGHIVEGKSLLPLLHGTTPDNWRDFVISEYSFAQLPIRKALGVSQRDARMCMIANHDFKMIHVEGGFRPMLFDLRRDHLELEDVGDRPEYAEVIEQLYRQLATWARRDSQRLTLSDEEVERRSAAGPLPNGILVGVFDEADVPQVNRDYYRHNTPERPDTSATRPAASGEPD